jgi:hypothetical protein
LNKATGKESGYETAFSEANWGDATRAYRKIVDDTLRLSSMETIITRASEYYKESRKKALKSLTASQPTNLDTPGFSAELVDLSD